MCVPVCMCVAGYPQAKVKLKHSNQLHPILFSVCIAPCIPQPPSNNLKKGLSDSPILFSILIQITICTFLSYFSSNVLWIFPSLKMSLSYSILPLHFIQVSCLTFHLLRRLLWTKAPSQIGLSLTLWPQYSFNKHSRVSALQDWLLNTHTHTHIQYKCARS